MSQMLHDSSPVSELLYFYFVFQTIHSIFKNPGFLEIVQICHKVHRARPKSVTGIILFLNLTVCNPSNSPFG